VRDVSCGAYECTPSIRSQLRAGGSKLSLDLAVNACDPHSAVGADGGAPAVDALAASSALLAVLAPAPHSAEGADGGAPAVLALAPHSVMLSNEVADTALVFVALSAVRADGGAPAVLA
jgi:hypothetical protein